MGLAQTLLTIAAIALLGMITLTLNSSYLTTNQTMVESEFSVEAVSIAESYLEIAAGKRFDEKLASDIADVDDLTPKDKLKKDSGENTLEEYDDFDDFNGFTEQDTTERSVYNVYMNVAYVEDNNPAVESVNLTFHKRMTVTVSNEYMSTPIKLQHVLSFLNNLFFQMGTNVILDILGSFIIGGMLLVNILNIQGNASNQSSLYSSTRITQKNLVTVVSILEYDFSKIGYGINDTSEAILTADSNKIVYLSDIDRNGTSNTISYYVGPTSELSSTPNPRDMLLYRKVDNEPPLSSNLGVTGFNLKYYDQDMNPESSPNEIAIIEISVRVENSFPIENTATGQLEYPKAFWKQTRIKARNLTR